QSKIALAVLAVLTVIAVAFIVRAAPRHAIIAARRWRRWEFWPAWLVYVPVGVYYLWLAIRYHGLSVPTSANPAIANGRFIGQSKLEILDQLRRTSPQFTAEAFLVDGRTMSDRLLSLHRFCREHKITLPFFLKPDVGQ